MYATADLYLSNVFAALMIFGALIQLMALVFGYRAGQKPVHTRSTFDDTMLAWVYYGIVSGRMQLVTLTIGCLMSLPFYMNEMPRMGLLCIISGFISMVFPTAFMLLHAKLRRANALG